MRHRWPALLAALMAFSLPTCLYATPANKKSLENYLGPFAKRAIDCRVCHVPDPPGTRASLDEVGKPHNVFGARLKAVRKELARAGKPNDLESRLQAIAQEDSDGDGVSNLLELLTGHFPGDPLDKATPEELTQAASKIEAFSKYQQRYRWQPFEPVIEPAVPTISSGDSKQGISEASWCRNPIDAFVAAARREQGLAVRPEVSREGLLRRVYLDLIGLPPTWQERADFLQDPDPQAYEKVVDRLLASPQHAERWARHWMDVWRYSDWAGYGQEIRESQPHIWRWRDWIVDSLQADKGYDQMVREMLAGDELAPEKPETIRATGFLVRNWFRFNRHVWLDQTVEHTAKAFLGVTINCARCHDHMYDPFSQEEYYSFRAIFEPHQIRTDRLPGQPDTTKDGVARVFDADLGSKTYLLIRGNEAQPDKDRPCDPGVPRALKGGPLQIQPVGLPRDAYQPEQRLFVLTEAVVVAETRLRQARAKAEKNRAQTIAASVGLLGKPVWPLVASPVRYHHELAGAEAEVLAAQLELMQARAALALRQGLDKADEAWAVRGQLLQRQRAVAEADVQVRVLEAQQFVSTVKARAKVNEQLKAARQALAAAESQLKKPLDASAADQPKYPSSSTGRRLALAKWITQRQNPLAARVAVNHVWMRHFGQPLVPTVFDFGNNGQPPTHPALLDYLAARFMDEGWSLKKLHRLIVTSATYRMDSTPEASSLARDPDNRYYWRRLPTRMEAEVVRDSLLHLAGRLDLTRGGPELDQERGLETRRRSLYYRHANEKQMVFLTTFDAAGPTECYRRASSVVPQQALALANSSLAQQTSDILARQLSKRLGPQTTPEAFIQSAFATVLGRSCTEAEHQLCRDFLREQENRLVGLSTGAATATHRSRASLVHVLLNHHEFVTIR